MTPQQTADELLTLWRIQRKAKIPANDRVLPQVPFDLVFERDLAVIRQVMERT